MSLYLIFKNIKKIYEWNLFIIGSLGSEKKWKRKDDKEPDNF